MRRYVPARQCRPEAQGRRVSADELRATAGSMVRFQIEGAVRRAGRSVLRVSVCALDAREGELLSIAVTCGAESSRCQQG